MKDKSIKLKVLNIGYRKQHSLISFPFDDDDDEEDDDDNDDDSNGVDFVTLWTVGGGPDRETDGRRRQTEREEQREGMGCF